MLFGSKRDFDLISHINRKLLSNILEQEILYYKVDLQNTRVNIYGESLSKTYFTPVKLNCLITRGDQVIGIEEIGPNMMREASFAFLREDLEDTVTVPEVGDIIEWSRDFYEVDVVKENQLFVGRDHKYNLTPYGERFGSSLSIIVDCHLTRKDIVGIEEFR